MGSEKTETEKKKIKDVMAKISRIWSTIERNSRRSNYIETFNTSLAVTYWSWRQYSRLCSFCLFLRRRLLWGKPVIMYESSTMVRLPSAHSPQMSSQQTGSTAMSVSHVRCQPQWNSMGLQKPASIWVFPQN